MPAKIFTPAYDLPTISNPGMITPEEEQLYYHLALTNWHPDREFIEFGTWLGRSTTRICQAFETIAPGQWRLTVYDGFRWHDDYTMKADRAGMPDCVRELKDGESFRDAFLTMMGDFAPNVRTYQGRISEAPQQLAGAWPSDARLGVVFVDASKGWDNTQVLKAIAPHLEVGTKIVFQDFFMSAAYYLQLLIMMFPELEPEAIVSKGGSYVVKVAAPIDPKHRLFHPRSIETVTEQELYAAATRLEQAIPKSKYEDEILATTLPLLLWHTGREAAAVNAARAAKLTAKQIAVLSRRLQKWPQLAIPPLQLMAAADALTEAQSDQ